MKKIIVIETEQMVRQLMGRIKSFSKEHKEIIKAKSPNCLEFEDVMVIFLDVTNFDYKRVMAKHEAPETLYFIRNTLETSMFDFSERVVKQEDVRWQGLMIEIFQLKPQKWFAVDFRSLAINLVETHEFESQPRDSYRSQQLANVRLSEYVEKKWNDNKNHIANMEKENKRYSQYFINNDYKNKEVI